jgi:hypothetical protein
MRILAAIGALAIVVAGAAAVFFFGGFLNVAGTQEDPAIVRWALSPSTATRMLSHRPTSMIRLASRPARANTPNMAASSATAALA